MRKLFLTVLIMVSLIAVQAQVTEPPGGTVEQQLEDITASNEDAETEDDSYLIELNSFLKNPVNLNTADRNLLEELKILSPMQIQSLISYRERLGLLVSIYELQAVPGWDVRTIQKLRPFITVSTEAAISTNILKRLRGGDKTLLIRATRVLENARGYLADTAGATSSYYAGSPEKLLIRYRYKYKNLLQYGFLGEKDPGEELFKGTQKQGFDFYSAHFFLRNSGIIKALALGDFSVNLGQGLTNWMNLAYRKGPDVLATKRQSAVLRPYSSPGEAFFFRGAGITLGNKNWEATVFASYKKTDANKLAGDTSSNIEDFISSFQTSGYHRTASEIEDKGAQRQMAFGGNFSYQYKGLHVGLNAIQFQLKFPLQKREQPYNLFALKGKSFGNYSMDYGYTYKNMHWFGEAAISDTKYKAFVNGLLISTSRNVDMSIFYRNISKGYQTLYGSAFTESTLPNNEKGLFVGMSVKPSQAWKIDAYADVFRFPWLKSRVDAPSGGSDYFLQVGYRPNKQLDMYARYKREEKAINFNVEDEMLNPVIPMPKKSFRYQLTYKVSPEFTFRTRTELAWYDKKGAAASEGFLLYADILYKPNMKPLSGNIRLQYFETEDYNSRFYAYENDLLYNYAIPVFYGKGYRYYINLNYDVNKKLSFWLKFAQTIYPDRTSIGSGLDEIKANKKSEIKLQLMYRY